MITDFIVLAVLKMLDAPGWLFIVTIADILIKAFLFSYNVYKGGKKQALKELEE